MGCLQSKSEKENFDYSTGSNTAGVILESTKPYVPPSFSAPPGPSSSGRGSSARDIIISDSEAIILASNYCKSSPFQWQDEALVRIGNKIQKWHFLVRGKDTESSKLTSMVLTLTSIKDSPISLSNSATNEAFGNLLCAITHPYLFPCEDVEFIRDKQILITVRKFAEKGSLKDLIYGKQNPKEKSSVKYRHENCRPLRPKVIRTFGRHILEALSALNAKGIICDSLKSSNILLDNGIARISELETTLLGYGLAEEVCDMIVEYELGAFSDNGKICAVDVILFGLVLLEMISGHPCHPNNFQNELQDEFCDRFASLNPSPENESLRDLLLSIFIRCDATVESLLGHPFFQSVELPHSPQRIKLQSVEKGLVKNAMAKSEELRERRREMILKKEEMQKEEKEKLGKEMEEAEMAEEIVTKRRNKSLRRASNGSTTGGGTGGGSSRRRSLQMSGNQTSASPSSSPAAALTTAPTKVNEQPEILTQTSSPLYSDPATTSPPPPPPPPPAPVPASPTAAASATSLPPQYQKLLNIGLSQEMVKHKMLADGFDPASVGW